MLFDHVGYVFFPEAEWMRVIGRMTMPIFAYAIARGFHYTSNRKRYLIRLSILAIISQVPFMLTFHEGWTLNTIFPWAITVAVLMAPLWTIPLVSTFGLFVPMDYTSLVILLPVFIYHFWFKEKRPVLLLLSTVPVLSFIAYISAPIQWFALLAIPLIWILEPYDGKVRLNKWVFYYFYPVHLMVIWVVSLLV